MSTKYLANRLKYHTASRVGAKETDPLLNALNKDQHTVHYSNVWTSPNNATKNDFPVNADNNAENSVGYNRNLPTDYNFKTNTDSTYATDNLIAIFKSGATSINFKNGKIWTNTSYPAVKLYEAVDMTPVTGSNGSGIYYEAYEVLDENNIRLIDWVSPMAVSDPVINKPIPGYAGKLELNDKETSNWVEVYKTDKSTASGVQGSVWDASYGNWEFVYSAGLAIFNADYTPTRYSSYFTTYNNGTAVKDVVKLRWTGFLYTGTYSDKKQDIVDVNISGALNVQGIDVKKGIVNMFAGATLPDSTNLDSYYTTGISRITNNIQGVKPSISSVAGFLQVMDIDHDDDTTSMKGYRRLRQIIYPDNADESTPYTRVGELNSLTGTVFWSEWNQMGGGSLRRVVVDGTTTAKTVNPTQNNVMYESFGENIFILPQASTVPVGTQVGIEQYINNGVVRVVNGSTIVYQQTITPSSTYILTSDITFQSGKAYFTFNGIEYVRATISVGSSVAANTYYELKQTEPTSYLFECVLNQDNSTREWVLDAEHNHGNMLTIMNARINNIGSGIADEVARATTRENIIETYAFNVHKEFIQNYKTAVARATKYVTWGAQINSISNIYPSEAQLNDPAQMYNFLYQNPYTIALYDLIISMRTNNATIVLPTPNSNVRVGTRITINVYPGYTCTINDTINSESFTADSTNILVLEFEFNHIPPGGADDLGWALLSLA